MTPKDLKQRTFDFAVSVAKLIDQLPNTISNRAYSSQIARSSSSIGANYRASQRAKSSKDFLNKLKIVEEETDETIYFLQLLTAINENHGLLIDPLVHEGVQILRIIVASINTTRRNMAK
ncbi:MAG TPA: four helix bundle protein [Flavisolibacter sp.]|nr:four helix bundle protein [Flavisolibacter sp.]